MFVRLGLRTNAIYSVKGLSGILPSIDVRVVYAEWEVNVIIDESKPLAERRQGLKPRCRRIGINLERVDTGRWLT